MKKLPLILSILAFAGVIALAIVDLTKGNTKKPAAVETEADALKGATVYFNMDRVLAEYDMANDLRSVFETKANSINQEVQRRVNKFQKDLNSFNDKINKGLITRSVAEAQAQQIQDRKNKFDAYAAQKEQEIAEEQMVMQNQIGDAIKKFVDAYNVEKEYAVIIATQGDILPAPVVAGDPSLDITDDLIAGLNAEYVKNKANNKTPAEKAE
jgi:outer membrane protein